MIPNLITPNTSTDRIRAHYIDGAELCESDKKIKERLQTAHSLRENEMNNRSVIVSILMKRFDISQAQAYEDIRNATFLFGKVTPLDKEGLRSMMTEWSIDLLRMAKQTKNLKAYEKALERLTKVNNLDKEDAEMPDMTKIQPPIQLITVAFDFIGSKYFSKIDTTTQKKILEMYQNFMKQLKLSPLAEYSDMFQITDIPHTVVDEI